MQIRWTPFASQALRTLGNHFREESPQAALSMESTIRSSVAHLQRHPAMGRVGRVLGTRELVITGTPYVVAYVVTDREVRILTVQHGAQKWPEIL